MNPQESLAFLYSAARNLNASAEVHEKIAEAVRVLNQVITPKSEDKKK